ncbi:MAG: DUF262 domain-containing protein, partial [Candidatus Thorarchaeota archaeon]
MKETMVNRPEPQSVPFSNLLNDIERGLVKIPQFQRDFVWTKEKSARLLDSIVKGYPIGTFILWKTKESLRTVRNLGSAHLPDTPPGDFIHYVLDGQQRLTSLFASIKGLEVPREERVDDFAEMYIDLAASEDEDIVKVENKSENPESMVRVVDLLNADFKFLASFPEEFHDKLRRYQDDIRNYQFSTIYVREAPI